MVHTALGSSLPSGELETHWQRELAASPRYSQAGGPPRTETSHATLSSSVDGFGAVLPCGTRQLRPAWLRSEPRVNSQTAVVGQQQGGDGQLLAECTIFSCSCEESHLIRQSPLRALAGPMPRHDGCRQRGAGCGPASGSSSNHL